MSLLFNMLSRFVIAFLSRKKYLLISWLQSPYAVIFEPKKRKLFTVSPSICHEVMGLHGESKEIFMMYRHSQRITFRITDLKRVSYFSSFFQNLRQPLTLSCNRYMLSLIYDVMTENILINQRKDGGVGGWMDG